LTKSNLNITFHNPNTSEDTIKHISALLAEVAVSKAISDRKAQPEQNHNVLMYPSAAVKKTDFCVSSSI